MKLFTNLLPAILLLLSLTINAQTNVSGGIYSDTTWTLSNSPYIVVDDIVVFSNVTLTIEPGVVVKFANLKTIQLRQARLIAEGTITDSITFTSNSSSPTPGIWNEIWLNGGNIQGLLYAKFNYCNFKYAQTGISYRITSSLGPIDTLIIRNSSFTYNNFGMRQDYPKVFTEIDSSNFFNNIDGAMHLVSNANINYCTVSNNKLGIVMFANGNNTINNCTILNNIDEGIRIPATTSESADSIISCQIKYNGIGIKTYTYIDPTIIIGNVFENDSIGIELNNSVDIIYCNKFCSNTAYNLYYKVPGGDANITNNYWCTTNLSVIASGIHDGYDDINFGLANFQPLDSMQCYLTISVNEINAQSFNFSIFPNPAFDYLTIAIPDPISDAEFRILNVLGELQYSSKIENQEINIDVSTLSSGIYFIEITAGNNFSRRKFIKQ